MKVIEATWEKRNLGKRVLEIELEFGDTVSAVTDAIDINNPDYVVIKVPSKLGELVGPIQLSGFKFVEVLNHTIFDSKLPNLNQFEKRFLSSLVTSPISPANKEILESTITAGLFNTDRISLDTKFDQKSSTNRYLGMITDEISKGAILYEITYKHDFIGFFLLRLLDQENCLSSLGGVIPKFQNKGVGVLMNYLQIQNSYDLGATRVLSTFSSNNVPATLIHWKYDYRLVKQEYIFTKHFD